MNVIKSCRHGTMVFNTNDRYIGRSLDLYGEYSEDEVAMFRRLIKSGDTVVDVGANIGALTVPLARIVGSTGKVVAFEPQHAMYYLLCANVVINNFSNVDCWLMAVGQQRGSIDVPVIDVTTKGNYGSLALNKKQEGEVATKAVPMVTLDNATLEKCDLIKIDVEGMELEVIKGALDTIKKHMPILCVEDDRPDQRDELRNLIWELGYHIIGHRPLLYSPDNFNDVNQNVFVDSITGKSFASFNLICVPREGLPNIDMYRDLMALRLPTMQGVFRI